MNTAALVMLVVSITILWGGLAASVAFLQRRPIVTEGPAAQDPDGDPPGGDARDAPLPRDT